MNSRAKGKRGELEARDALRQHLGCQKAKRGQQRSGLEQADVVDAIPNAHIEVKRRRRIAAMAFMRQAERDAWAGETPVVVMREDHGEWVVAVKLCDVMTFCERVAAIKGQPIYPGEPIATVAQ